MEKFLGGLIAWAMICGAAFLFSSLAISFIDLEWQWAGGSHLSRLGLVLLFLWFGALIIKGDKA